MSLEHSPARSGKAPTGHRGGAESKEKEVKPPRPVAVDRLVGEAECKRLTDLSRVTRWRMMRRGEFPAKVVLSPGRRAWRLSAIVEWMAEREAA